MIHIKVDIKPNLQDAKAMCHEAVSIALAKIKEIEKMVEDIRDPVTGEGAKVTWEMSPEGVVVSINGSPFVRAEAEKRSIALAKAH
jgi:hypothetical protein